MSESEGVEAVERNGQLNIVLWLAEERDNAVMDEEAMRCAA